MVTTLVLEFPSMNTFLVSCRESLSYHLIEPVFHVWYGRADVSREMPIPYHCHIPMSLTTSGSNEILDLRGEYS